MNRIHIERIKNLEKVKRLPEDLMIDYLIGYFKAIDLLLLKLNNEKSLFFPITFLLAHYMELWIKTIGLYYTLDYYMYDMKGLEITGHNVRELIDKSEQREEFLNNGISEKEINDVLKTWEYFEKFTNKESLSIAMRYPISPKNNNPTTNNFIVEEYEKINIQEYKKMIRQIEKQTNKILIKFFDAEAKRFEKLDASLRKEIENKKNI